MIFKWTFDSLSFNLIFFSSLFWILMENIFIQTICLNIFDIGNCGFHSLHFWFWFPQKKRSSSKYCKKKKPAWNWQNNNKVFLLFFRHCLFYKESFEFLLSSSFFDVFGLSQHWNIEAIEIDFSKSFISFDAFFSQAKVFFSLQLLSFTRSNWSLIFGSTCIGHCKVKSNARW